MKAAHFTLNHQFSPRFEVLNGIKLVKLDGCNILINLNNFSGAGNGDEYSCKWHLEQVAGCYGYSGLPRNRTGTIFSLGLQFAAVGNYRFELR
jgi:hypothetical protein